MADLSGEPLLQYAVKTALSVDFPVFSVIPGNSVARRALLTARGVEIINNPSPETGQGMSIALGVKHMMEAGVDAAVLMLADMPFITPGHLRALLRAAEDHEVVLSAVNDTAMPPAIVQGEALKSLCHIPPEMGAKKSLTSGQYHIIPLPAEQARDMDSVSDLLSMRSQIKGAKA